MQPFEPVGKTARWRIIYDILTTRSVGDIITYQELGDALDLDPDDEHDRRKIQMAMQRAAKEYEVVDKRALDVTINVGYTVVPPGEHIRLANRHRRRADSQLARGHSKAVNVDMNGLDEQGKQAIELIARGFALQRDFNRRITDQQTRQDRLIDELYGRVANLERQQGVIGPGVSGSESGHDSVD